MASVRGRKQGKVSGSKEGSGEGKGEGDGGQETGRSVQAEGENVFAFGKGSEGERSAATGSGVNQRANASKGVANLSYRDKLLSPGCAGFLVKHSEEDDIMQGWKDYFHRMNEKDYQCDLEASDEEDNPTVRRVEGKPEKLSFTAEEYAAWCMPWMNSLIIKTLGATFPTYVIRDRINRMWRPKDPLKLIPLSNGYFIVSFSNKEDRAYAFQEGPWMIEDHYLTVQQWRPNFNPQKADLQCNIAAWVRLPDVPFEFYNVESLRRIGNMIGKMIKVDRSTSIYDKGGFARICVEIDLKKPLLPTYLIFGEERPIIYEGLHQVCLGCGKYGHQKNVCPVLVCQQRMPTSEQGEGKASADGDGGNKKDGGKEKVAGSNGSGKVSGDGDSNQNPFGKIKILRRDFRGQFNGADSRRKANETSEEGMSLNGINGIKKGLKKDVGPPKSEWVQVGAKRKSESKGRFKGKENKAPTRNRVSRVPPVAQVLESNSSNSFQALQEVEAQPNHMTHMDMQGPKVSTEDTQDMHQSGINSTLTREFLAQATGYFGTQELNVQAEVREGFSAV
ncbi:hypothetical protein K1719_027647 [Acacia pycnantha]|nr:hypothetical protein K1719_027647 [Acacia pycnantha]